MPTGGDDLVTFDTFGYGRPYYARWWDASSGASRPAFLSSQGTTRGMDCTCLREQFINKTREMVNLQTEIQLRLASSWTRHYPSHYSQGSNPTTATACSPGLFAVFKPEDTLAS